MTPSKAATRQAAHIYTAVFLRARGSIDVKLQQARAASSHVRRTADLPPPSRGEAERLVAEFCAQRGVTVCRAAVGSLPKWVQDLQDALPGGETDLT